MFPGCSSLQRHRVRRKSIKLVLQPPLPRKHPHRSPDDFNNHLCSHSIRHFALLGSYSLRPWSSLRMSPLLVEISAFCLPCPPQVQAQCLESSGTFCPQCGNLHHTHNHFVLTGSQQFSARPGCQLSSKSPVSPAWWVYCFPWVCKSFILLTVCKNIIGLWRSLCMLKSPHLLCKLKNGSVSHVSSPFFTPAGYLGSAG